MTAFSVTSAIPLPHFWQLDAESSRVHAGEIPDPETLQYRTGRCSL